MSIRNNLLANERIIFHTRLHWMFFVSPLIIFIFGFFVAILALTYNEIMYLPAYYFEYIGYVTTAIGTINLVIVYLKHQSSEYVVTNQRVFAQRGFFNRTTTSLILSKVEGVQVRQTLSGRIFNFGTIEITGTGTASSKFKHIYNPVKFRRAIQKNIKLDEDD